MFYFCHLKKLVRPGTFGPYYVHASTFNKICVDHITRNMLRYSIVLVVCELLTRNESLSAFFYACYSSLKSLKIILIKFCVGQGIITNCLENLCLRSLMSCTTLTLYGAQNECYHFCIKNHPFVHRIRTDLHRKGDNQHFELIRVSCNKSFN